MFIKLPKLIQPDERLEFTMDEFGNPHCYVVGPISKTTPPVKYEVSEMLIGENGFFMPPGGGHAVVLFADGGPNSYINPNATVRKFEMTIRPREFGGVL